MKSRSPVCRLMAAFTGGASGSSESVCAAIAVAPVPDDRVSPYGILVPDRDFERDKSNGHSYPAPSWFQAADVVEKPRPSELRSRWAVMGRYVLGPSVLEELARTR